MDYLSEDLDHEKHWPCNMYCREEKPAIEPTASGLIDDIMKKYFCQKAGQASSCSLFSYPQRSVHSMDRRLQYWAQILDDRKRIACRIQRLTGKRLSHVLYNQIEEHRHVQNVKRVIDIAERLKPTYLSSRKVEDIKQTLFETLPRTERLQTADFEIVGTPKSAMAEQWLHDSGNGKNSFFRSVYLQRKLRSTTQEGPEILEFYPDIEKLEVIGRRIHKHRKPSAELISDFELSLLSSTSNGATAVEFPDYCLQINDKVIRSDARLAETMTFYLQFSCTPFQSETQTVCRVKNVGKKPVGLYVRRIKPKGAAYMPTFKKVFHFNFNSIRLGFGESIEIEITFHSDDQRGQKDVYCLLTEPNLMEDTYNILFKLTGECRVPNNYYGSMIGSMLDAVIENIISGTVCDALARRKEVLSEKEMFNKQNPGYECEPHDLRRLCEIYRQARRKYHSTQWNMNLQSLKETIEAVPDFGLRSAHLEVFNETIRAMRRRVPGDGNIKVLLARTVIAAVFDKWEKKAQKIQRAVASTDIDVLVIKMPFETVMERIKLCRSESEKRGVILHYALFIQMFCSLCELAEDIVSYVENCVKLHAF